MKINWKNSISVRINSGMIGILISLFILTALSIWMNKKFNDLTYRVSAQHLPELSNSSDLHLAIKNIHRKINSLTHSESKIANRIIVRDLIDELYQVSVVIGKLFNDEYSKTLRLMSKELLPIINSYSLEVDKFLFKKNELRRKIMLLDKLYIVQLEKHEIKEHVHNGILNKLYISARSLPDLPTTFKFKEAQKKIKSLIKELKANSFSGSGLYNVIENPSDGIIALLNSQYDIKLRLSVLNTQTKVIVEQLNSISFEKVTELKKLVEASTLELHNTSSQLNTICLVIVLFTTLFTVALMYFFHQSISKRLMVIAKSIGAKEDQQQLIQESKGSSEISIIAKSIVKYISRHEQQSKEIQANNKQLMMIIDNSNQAVIIYCEDQIVYCNAYCNQVLDLNAETNTDIVSQSLLMAINTMTYKDRLKVGPFYFRFFATEIDWNGKSSTLALLIDITNEVKKEDQLIKTLEVVKDESLTDTLTGLHNRRKLELFIEQDTALAYSLIIADIDWFKAFNDYYGHAEGDLCITKVAMAIKGCLRTEDDLAIRYGGEEFVILLVGSTMQQAELVADRIQSIILKFDIKHEKSVFNQLSLSLGIAHSSELDDGNWNELFDMADNRLYQAKSNGRARVVSSDHKNALQNGRMN